MIRTYAQRADYNNRVEIHLIAEDGNGSRSIARPVVFEKEEEGLMTFPALSLKRDDAQRMMDALWDAGLRPTEGSGSAGSLAATERHLADMRTLTFHALNVKP